MNIMIEYRVAIIETLRSTGLQQLCPNKQNRKIAIGELECSGRVPQSSEFGSSGPTIIEKLGKLAVDDGM
ncbi:hypothetical protein TNCV_3858431 [Trichonephila clavipes]|nr:hypothetical protein TNCV_3858431 [Trichonephila clavipes]